MSEQRLTVVRVGVHDEKALEPERSEIERIGARYVVLPLLFTEQEMVEQTSGADGLVIVDSPVTHRVLAASPNCKVVVRTGVGVDTVDVDAATELGVAVVNVPDLWVREVANHAMALLLACTRRIVTFDRWVRSGKWQFTIPSPAGSIHGETLGLVGLGKIGRNMATRAAAFGLELVAYDPYVEPDVFEEYRVAPVSFDELLSRSDYVSIHSPLTDETRRMFDEAAFRSMKPSAYLINTARGPIVDQAALTRALCEEWIAGAGVDVYEEEPPDSEDPLMSLDNVVLTSHTAWHSDPALAQLPGRCGQEVVRVLTGRMPLNLVNPEVLEKLPLV